MANICDNTFYCNSYNEDDIDLIEKKLGKEYNCTYIDRIDENSLEVKFESNWAFPEMQMKELTAALEDPSLIYIRVLSTDLCNEYVAFHVYSNEEWQTKI